MRSSGGVDHNIIFFVQRKQTSQIDSVRRLGCLRFPARSEVHSERWKPSTPGAPKGRAVGRGSTEAVARTNLRAKSDSRGRGRELVGRRGRGSAGNKIWEGRLVVADREVRSRQQRPSRRRRWVRKRKFEPWWPRCAIKVRQREGGKLCNY